VIRLDRKLEHLTLRMEDGFADEASVALAEALTLNKTLRRITLSVKHVHTSRYMHNKVILGEAFGAMLRGNTSLNLEVPSSDDAVGHERIVDSRNQMRIEQGMHTVDCRGLLASNQTTR
jgi:hypothetical protein